MDAGLLKQLFGPARGWHGPCVVLVDAETSVKTTGPDSIVTGGMKSYAPRVTSGRMVADAVCYHPEFNSLLVVQRVKSKHSTGEDVVHQTLIAVDTAHVVGLEFEGLDHLADIGLKVPPLPEKQHYAAGTLVG